MITVLATRNVHIPNPSLVAARLLLLLFLLLLLLPAAAAATSTIATTVTVGTPTADVMVPVAAAVLQSLHTCATARR